MIFSDDDGAPADCGPFFSQTLDELNIPSFEGVDEEIRTAIDAIATRGVAALNDADETPASDPTDSEGASE